jgi:hypothetical protein
MRTLLVTLGLLACVMVTSAHADSLPARDITCVLQAPVPGGKTYYSNIFSKTFPTPTTTDGRHNPSVAAVISADGFSTKEIDLSHLPPEVADGTRVIYFSRCDLLFNQQYNVAIILGKVDRSRPNNLNTDDGVIMGEVGDFSVGYNKGKLSAACYFSDLMN